MKEKTIYALGFFDGVHLGHQALLATCRELAENAGCSAGIVTFSTHPDALVFGDAPVLINSPQDREFLLKTQFHMDSVVSLPFDKALMNMAWQDFIRLLQEEYAAAGFVCGDDFRFGKGGVGSAEGLLEYCREENLPCAVVPGQFVGQTRVSSSYIRQLLHAGEMEEAVRFLGHPHILTGQVIAGRGLGHTIGIPTANILIPEGVLCPRHGVYACRATVDGQVYPAVTNVGTRPTVGGHQARVEAWLLDFDGDLYGKTIALSFYSFLRPEQKFPSLEKLKEEIEKDRAKTRKFFEKT